VTAFSVTGDYKGFGITSCCQLLIAGSMFLQTFGNDHRVTKPHRARISIINTSIIVTSSNLENFETQIDKIFGDINNWFKINQLVLN